MLLLPVMMNIVPVLSNLAPSQYFYPQYEEYDYYEQPRPPTIKSLITILEEEDFPSNCPGEQENEETKQNLEWNEWD